MCKSRLDGQAGPRTVQAVRLRDVALVIGGLCAFVATVPPTSTAFAGTPGHRGQGTHEQVPGPEGDEAPGSDTGAPQDAVESAISVVAQTQGELLRAWNAVLAAETAAAAAGERLEAASTGLSIQAGVLVSAENDREAAILQTYVSGSAVSSVARLQLNPGDAPIGRATLDAVLDRRKARVQAAEESWGAAGEQVRDASVLLLAAHERVRIAHEEYELARRKADEAIVSLTEAQEALTRSRLVELALSGEQVEMPAVALVAYKNAAEWASVDLNCDVPWWALAAIGRHESHHGEYRSPLFADGSSMPRIIGIPLDGTRSLVVRDSDSGVLDGDPVWVRAVGPMQAIPSTWFWYARNFDLDGDANGVEDPNNIHDATRLAASLLCRNSRALRTEEGLRRGLWSYNPSHAYNDRVFATARQYAELDAAPS